MKMNARFRVFSKVSTLCVALLTLSYLAYWHQSNHRVLYDPFVQTDDVRIQLSPFHMYRQNPELKHDPILARAESALPFAFKGVYVFIQQWLPLFQVTKVLQWVCIALMFGAVTAFRKHRHKVVLGAFAIFFMFHTQYVSKHIVSALPRAFALPCMMLWAAGFVTDRFAYRAAATVVGFLFYPPIGLILISVEGILFLKSIDLKSISLQTIQKSKPFLILVLISAIAIAPSMISGKKAGRLHTYEEALSNPAFSKTGRNVKNEQVPFDNISHLIAIGDAAIAPLRANGKSLLPSLTPLIQMNRYIFAALVIILLLWLTLSRRVPTPKGFLAIVLTSVILYFLGRWLAFLLYAPIRFFQYGIWLATIVLVLEVLVSFSKKAVNSKQSFLFSSGVLALMLTMLVLGGTGLKADNLGVKIRYEEQPKMYDFIGALPRDTRILQHPMDDNSIAFWTARSTTIMYEMLVPWYIEAWQENEKRAQEALSAMYADSVEDFFGYVRENKITHVLINPSRYQEDFQSKSEVFSPLTEWIEMRLANQKLQDLVFSDIPPDAIVFRNHDYLVVEVTKLREIWNPSAE